eukprot:12810457-Prorocentrum_lima.AAC.1
MLQVLATADQGLPEQPGRAHHTEAPGEPKFQKAGTLLTAGEKTKSTAAKKEKHQTGKERMANKLSRRSRARRKKRKKLGGMA